MSLSARSLANLKEAHPDLQRVIYQLIKDYPGLKFQINDAQRGRAEQEAAYRNKTSKAHFGQSAHNYKPAVALDIYPLPVSFTKIQPYRDLAKAIISTASKLGVGIEWGGSWPSLRDYPHYELSNWKTLVKQGKVKLI